MSEKEHKFLKSVGLTVAVTLFLMTPVIIYLGLKMQEQAADQAAGAAAERPVTKAKRAYPEFEAPAADANPEHATTAARRPEPLPAPPPRLSPAPDNIPVGMEKSKLLASFGRPQMITTQVSEGRPFETFHYLLPQEGTETTVTLSGGRVVSAASNPY